MMGIAMRFASLTAFLVLGLVAEARAQNPPVPKFEFQKPPEKPVDWKVQSKGGFLLTTGNSRSTNGTLSLNGSRHSGDNKLSLQGGIAYGRSRVSTPVVTPIGGTNFVTGFADRSETSQNEWNAQGRYDRFLTENNAAYILGQIASDKVAGKFLFGGGQIGYSRQIWKSERHTAVAELGYDFSYESYVSTPGTDQGTVAIHSARVFLGELFSITKDTGLDLSAEALFNLNEEKEALVASNTAMEEKGVDAFEDTRLVGKATLTTSLWKNLAFGFGFTFRYDQNPALRPIPGSAGGASYAPGALRFSDKVDTSTEATLVFTFL